MRRLISLASFFLIVLGAMASAGADEAPHFKLYTIKAPFAEVKQDVLDAITGQGFVVDFNGNIGQMLDRTAEDVGATRRVYDKAELLQFCSVKASREAFEADPANLIFCPYVIVLYTLHGDPASVHVGYRRPIVVVGTLESRRALLQIEVLLDGIVREALDLN